MLQDEVLIKNERRSAVARAITSLPPKYRAAIVLRDVEGLSYDQIADALKLSEGTVKSRINRARNLLKEKLTAYI
jgi:RNA polymerase sigma-70 factor (ECF subfamily)